jgi:hypothetical protein
VREVLLDSVAAVGVELLMQVVADAACRNFDDQLGWAFEVAVRGDARTPANRCRQAQQEVRLRLVVEVESQRRVVACDQARRLLPVVAEPAPQNGVWLTVTQQTDRRSHVDDSLDELGLLQVRHRGVASFELVARELVASAGARERGGDVVMRSAMSKVEWRTEESTGNRR